MSYSKYRAVRVEADGISFASKKEARRYQELKLLERAGEIIYLRTQVPFTLIEKSDYGREVRYVADFVYFQDGKMIVEDTKGIRTPVYKLKKRMLAEKWKIEIKET